MTRILPYSLVLFMLILNLSAIFSIDSTLFNICNLLPLLFMFFVVLSAGNGLKFLLCNIKNNKEITLLLFYLVFIIIGVARSTQLDVLSQRNIVYDIIYVILIFFYALQVSLVSEDMLKYLFVGILLYAIANLLLSMIGIENPASSGTITEEASMLKYLGIEIERKLYPLSLGSSKAVTGIISGTLVVYLFALWPKSKNKMLLLLLSLVPLWLIISTDSRSTLLACIFSLVIFNFTRMFNIKSIRYLPFAIPIFPLLFLLISYIAFESGIADKIGREGSVDISTGRSFIWFIAIDELSDFKPIHLIGYGSYGQTVSGISYDYMNMFRDWSDDNPELYSLHNVAIQTIYDIGYVGLLLFVYLYYKIISITVVSCNKKLNALAPVMIFIMLGGVTEITPLLYNKNMFSIFIIISVYLAVKLKNIAPVASSI